MDSLTQIVLGGAVGELTLGRKIGNRAILWGAIAGTIPDLDVITSNFVDDLTANEWHRGFSHSIFFCLVASPVFAWLVRKSEKIFLTFFLAIVFFILIMGVSSVSSTMILLGIYALFLFLIFGLSKEKGTEATRKDWTKLFFWCLVTHPFLDCHTSWGTQLLWPLPYKFAWNNIFVVDFFYTLPFLICLLLAMFFHRESNIRSKLNKLGLILSSFYMLMSLAFKYVTFKDYENALAKQNIEYIKISTRPTPFNTVLWLANVEAKDSYYFGYRSLFDKSDHIDFVQVFKNHDWIDHWKDERDIQRLIKLSKNEWAITKSDSCFYFNDLRFGQMGSPSEDGEFVFAYILKEGPNGLEVTGIPPPEPEKEELGPVLNELFERAKGI